MITFYQLLKFEETRFSFTLKTLYHYLNKRQQMSQWELNFQNKKKFRKMQQIPHKISHSLGCLRIFKIKAYQLNKVELNRNLRKWRRKFYISIHKLLEISSVCLIFCLILKLLLLIILLLI